MPTDPQAHPNRLAQSAHIRSATDQDGPAIARAIGRAFYDDPVTEYLFPSDARRETGFGAFAGLAMIQFEKSGQVDVAEAPEAAINGAAIWQAPDPEPLGVLQQFALGMRFWWIIRGQAGRAAKLMEAMQENYPKVPHWYLATLGVVPEAQGEGLGSALIQPVLERCDKEGQIAYLESSKEVNIPFYQRHGFKVSGEIQLRDGPRFWPMERAPH